MKNETFLKKLGLNISSIREKKGISQMEMARRLATGNNQIRRIEKGLVGVNILTLRSIAIELDMSVSDLVDIEK